MAKLTNTQVEIYPELSEREAPRLPQPLAFLMEFIASIIQVNLLLAALLFPASLTPKHDDEVQISPLFPFWCLFLGAVFLVLHSLAIFMLVTRSELIAFAKVLFVCLSWTLALFFLIIVNQQHNLADLFNAAEEEAAQVRDESVMLIRAAQVGLRGLRLKLYGQVDALPSFNVSELLKSIGPLALLLIKKEKSIMTWAMACMSLAGKGFSLAQKLVKKN